jgi:hypothetical protein
MLGAECTRRAGFLARVGPLDDVFVRAEACDPRVHVSKGARGSSMTCTVILPATV